MVAVLGVLGVSRLNLRHYPIFNTGIFALYVCGKWSGEPFPHWERLLKGLGRSLTTPYFICMNSWFCPTERPTFIGNPNNKKQYGLKAGLRKFAERGNDAQMKELRQFHVLCCFSPKDPTTLSRDDRRKALASLMFLTKKRTGKVKARGCADGSKQCEHIP